MGKKYVIRDNDAEYEVERVDEIGDDEIDNIESEVVDAFTPEEISALKRIAESANDILALIDNKPEEEPEEVVNEDVDEVVEDEEPDDEEIIVDTEEEPEYEPEEKYELRRTDSRRSIGAIERSHKKDSIDNHAESIEKAWGKRYGGTK